VSPRKGSAKSRTATAAAKPAHAPAASGDLLRDAQDAVRQAAAAIGRLADALPPKFLAAAEMLRDCKGMVVVTGMGKAGLIGEKVSATLASTGTRSMFLHPADAVHGDLGRIYHEDVVLAFSASGATQEMLRLLDPLRSIGARLIVITGQSDSPLGRHADLVMSVGKVVEACPLGLAPTTSTSVMLAIGDALALTVMRMKKFTRDDFARFHPAGSLGIKLLKVGDLMRKGSANPTVASGATVHDALGVMTVTKAGAVAIVDAGGRVVGLFTDGDFRRLAQQRRGDGPFDPWKHAIDEVMTRDPTTIGATHLASEAFRLMKDHQFDQIVVVDDQGRPVGLLDVQDRPVGLLDEPEPPVGQT
jgi:arabinose-5-phosphate isomerase